MQKLAWLLTPLLMMASAAPTLALDEAAARAVIAKAVDLYIRPAYVDFHVKAAALSAETGKLCAAPSDDQLKTVSARFADTIEAWGKVEIIREGPVLEQNRFERVLFYPDRKSTGLKQVQALIADPDESVTNPDSLRDRSVAMQGLGAFEYVFFGSYPEGVISGKDSFRCRYGLAIARNIETIGGELDAAWGAPDGIADAWKNPSADNPVYRNGAEAMQALIGLHVHGIEMVRDQRFKAFYKGRDQRMLPNAAVFRRSGNTIRAITANVEGLAKLWQVSDMNALLPADKRSSASSVLFDYKAATAAIRKLQAPTADMLKDDKYLAKLDFIEFTLKDAMTRIDTDIGAAVGLSAGFSFADGD
ncbi:MAG: iron-regulated protein precursor [Rhizobium sp.]|nr:iron-regulated protein precursor [Rhizobium sp.]